MAPGSEIEYDLRKQQDTLQHRGLDFNDAPDVFAGKTLSMVDDRQNYGEERIITVGKLTGKVTVIVWTQRGKKRRIISMRYANERERQQYEQHLV
ncbi:BrnT family toxin [Halomonas vilamensis]|uniref:BrnT family toxin n=1 Tax=Vreelandella vilamensis TaxID=531309 RepID=A0ABU1H821_9GAMM|nr:BrnT family toxin [Halomonas vilamensis]MDR5900449.1 BrnT family toxin [Halomonas vilamensis]